MATQVKERPILFSGPMVKALLAGTKTVTRRLVKNADWLACLSGDCPHDTQAECDATLPGFCPYGKAGDRLWVRETWAAVKQGGACSPAEATYACFPDGSQIFRCGGYYPETKAVCALNWPTGWRWRPSIFMPRWASRITLEIVSVRVERLQEIHHKTAEFEAEGIELPPDELYPYTNRADKLERRFRYLWNKLNGKSHPWNDNPWVWRIEFRKL